MLVSESEDEFELLLSDSDRDSLDADDDKDDLTEESSGEEWNSPPRRRSLRASPALKSPPQRGLCSEGGGPAAASPPKKQRSSPKTCKKPPPTPRKKTRSAKRHHDDHGGEEQQEEEERWHGVDEEDVEPPQPRFRPERDAGPQLSRTASYSPLQLFQLFFSGAVVDTLVRNSNAYGRKRQQQQRPVTAADMHSFLSLVLYMGLVPLKTLSDFWRGSPLFHLPFPASVMPRRRFLAVSRSLHMNDPAAEAANDRRKGTAAYDKLCKIKPLYEQIRAACHAFFHPYQHLSIDERMVASKARIGLKQYVKNKPTKWGFKLFVLADSACGYTLNFFVYGGKEAPPTGKGQGYDVVMRLLDNLPFLGKGYKLYVDNFYTSPALFRDLLRRKVWACGTVRPHVAGFPKDETARAAPRGSIRWLRRGELLFVKWQDAREVRMCSTLHRAFSGDTAGRKVKDGAGRWTARQVPVPGCIKDYNRHMGGVDLSDALISYYNVLHKTRRWYKTLFFHFVDIATVNAFILHKEMCKLQRRPALTQKRFREELILSLAEIGSAPRRAPPRPFPAAATAAAPSAGHLPAYFVAERSDVSPRYRATIGRRACVVCKRKSPVYCSTCKKTLCFTSLRNCYGEWHRGNGVCA